MNTDFWTNFKEGNALVSGRKYEEAASYYNEAIRSSNESTEHALALEGLYATAMRAGDIHSAIGYLRRAVEADPSSPHMIRMTCALGAQYARVNAMDEALAIQSKLLHHMDWKHAGGAGYNFVK
ncbi:tetratricopeptide repeat protein [Methylorubrum populi]|uniref:tetratricopeptide repeat protein n=1 Tax=Methylorubrum populi TaxID=223967 RepID=UPI00164855AD|nr:tetratricopeptide repeat protein [Methylorubrum populi]